MSLPTIVTAYFKMRSKAPHSAYEEWMRNLLSLQDSMIIYTTEDLKEHMYELRGHAINRTQVIATELNTTRAARLCDSAGALCGETDSLAWWQRQLEIDPERDLHQSFELFWVWLSKSEFVSRAIGLDPFGSEVFIWSDIGCFREPSYNGRLWASNLEAVPLNSLLMMQVDPFPPLPEGKLYVKDLECHAAKTPSGPGAYRGSCIPVAPVAGAQLAGRKDTWGRWEPLFDATLREVRVG